MVYGILAVLAVRRPLLARLAAREAVRRPWQSALVVGGLMISSASITASLVGADSQRDSQELNAYRQWGRVDLIVTRGGPFFSPEVANRIVGDQTLRPSITGVQAGVELVGSVADLDRQLARPIVRLIGFDASTQAPFGSFVLSDGTRTEGQELTAGQVLVSHQLADFLEARVGDSLQLSVEQMATAGPTLLTVAGIVRPDGPGSYGLRPALFLPLETAQRLAGTEQINVVRISAKGEGRAEVETAHRIAPAVNAALADLPDGKTLEVRGVKHDHVKAIEQATRLNRYFLLGMSFLIIMAAATLVINLMMALADERRSRLAVLRAIGITRGDLVVTSVMEGALYSLVAALLGTIPGILAGQVVALRQNDAFTAFTGQRGDYVFHLSVHPATVAVSVMTAALITLGTLFIVALRTSRMSIASAVRDLPEPPVKPRSQRPQRVALASSAMLALIILVVGSYLGRLVGGYALIMVAAGVSGRMIPDRARATLMGAALAAWSFGIASTLNLRGDLRIFISTFFLAVLGSAIGLCIVAAANLQAVETLSRFGGRGRPRASLRPALAYLARRPWRSGLASGAFAVVLALVTVFAVIISLVRPHYEWDSRGYTIRLASAGPTAITLPPALQGLVMSEAAITTRSYVGPFQSTFLGGDGLLIPLYEISETSPDHLPLHLTGHDPRFHSEAGVWKAIQEDPTWVIANFGNPGEMITLQGARGPVHLRIAAAAPPGLMDGVIGSREALAPFGPASVGTTLFLRTRPDADPKAVARDMRRALFTQGVDATPTRELLDEGNRGGNAAWLRCSTHSCGWVS